MALCPSPANNASAGSTNNLISVTAESGKCLLGASCAHALGNAPRRAAAQRHALPVITAHKSAFLSR
ncbi:hypothetical protein, partial [Pseudomonas syringae]|uniref:hypothetical protein n=1 Tax=Pseudomonas syringae TaxID=317 RepID=UPI001FEEED04